MEVYVDDMLVKSTESGNHAHDLREAFEMLKQYGMKLNPSQMCIRGIIWEVSRLYGPEQRELRPIPRRSRRSWECSLRRQRSSASSSQGD
jgi:hypothetical protein